MRKATTANGPKFSEVSRSFTFPAPTGGLNTKDPIPSIPITQVQYIYNGYATGSGIKQAPTLYAFATPADYPETMMVYTTQTGADTLFVAAGTAFYNQTAGGAYGAAVVSGLTNAQWQWVNFANSAGSICLCAFNGADSPRYWDGATWTTVTGVSTPAITGLTTSTIINVFVHQRRMWLIQKDSLKAWYLPPDSVGGAVQALDLGGIATKGGYIMAGGTWTIDGGDGVNDMWAVITSEGQVVVYQGNDPSSASTWSLVGVWNITPPIGRTCAYKYQNDLLFMVDEGIVSLRKLIGSQYPITITDNVLGTYKRLVYYVRSLGYPSRWQITESPAQDILIFLPQTAGTAMIMNRTTGAWGCFRDPNSTSGYYSVCFLNGFAMIGQGDAIFKVDENQTNGTATKITTAYSDFGIKRKKMITQARSFLYSTSGSTSGVGYTSGADFQAISPPSQSSQGAIFDGSTPWHQDGITASGNTIAISIYFSDQSPTYGGIEVLYQVGGLI